MRVEVASNTSTHLLSFSDGELFLVVEIVTEMGLVFFVLDIWIHREHGSRLFFNLELSTGQIDTVSSEWRLVRATHTTHSWINFDGIVRVASDVEVSTEL